MSNPSGLCSELNLTDITLGPAIATGASANVHIATLTTTRPQKVAVRIPRITTSASLSRFEHEVQLRSRLHHPNVLELLGACTKPPKYWTVSPWMEGGTVFDVLHGDDKCREKTRGKGGLGRRVRWARDVARGLMYLHEMGVVHRDVKSSNVLIGKDESDVDGGLEKVVVADLDLCREIGNGMNVVGSGDALSNAGKGTVEKGRERDMERGPSNGRLRNMVGTMVYMSPEVLQGGFGGYEADVYSFGVLLNEMLTETVPYVDRRLPVPELHTVLETRFNETKLRAAIAGGLRPVLVDGVPEVLREVIEACWSSDVMKRPRMAQVLKVLEEVCNMTDDELKSFEWDREKENKGNMEDESTLDSSEKGESSEEVREEVARLENLANPIPPPSESALVTLKMTTSEEGYVPTVCSGLSSTSGKRGEDRMEDRASIVEDAHGCTILAVYDGHGGVTCADFVSRVLPLSLYHSWSLPNSTFRKSLQQAFLHTDRLFLHHPDHFNDDSGTTAIVALLVSNRLYVANAGDCRAVLGKSDGSFVQLTNDHVVDDHRERAAVERRGGKLINDRVQGRMIVTRALGDGAVKQYITSEPEITEIELTPEDEFLVIASDGLWDVVTTQMAVDLIRSTVRVPDMAAKRLALKAIELGSGDNISVVVSFLTPVSNMVYVNGTDS